MTEMLLNYAHVTRDWPKCNKTTSLCINRKLSATVGNRLQPVLADGDVYEQQQRRFPTILNTNGGTGH